MKLFKKEYYEKMFAKRSQTVQDYQLQILHAQDKIKQLQSECPHIETTLTMYMSRPGAIEAARVCNACSLPNFKITFEESKEAWNKWYRGAEVYASNPIKSDVE